MARSGTIACSDGQHKTGYAEQKTKKLQKTMNADFSWMAELFCKYILAAHDQNTLRQQQDELKKTRNYVGVYKAAAAVDYVVSLTAGAGW